MDRVEALERVLILAKDKHEDEFFDGSQEPAEFKADKKAIEVVDELMTKLAILDLVAAGLVEKIGEGEGAIYKTIAPKD